MITIYAVQGCNRCKKLIELLSNEKIEYKVYYDEEKYEGIYDYLEYLLECYVYPIISVNTPFNVYEKVEKGYYIVDISSSSNEPFVLKYNYINHALDLIKQNI